MRIIILLVPLLFIALPAMSQRIDSLYAQERADFTTRIVQKLDDFQDNLKIIVAGKERSTKLAAKDRVLKLFIGEGKPYKYKDNDDVIRWHRAAQVQKSSKRRDTRQSMDSYLTLLSNMQGIRYNRITIDQADAIRLGNITSTNDGKYMAIASVLQHFCGYRDGKLVINDYAVRTFKVYIDHADLGNYQTEYQTENGTILIIYDVKLGDIKITEAWH